MQHQMREEQGHIVVSLSGDVELESSPKARELLLGSVNQGRQVLVDLAAVTYMDSSGVASLVEAFQRARKHGTGFALVLVNHAVLRVLKLARLDRVFIIHDTLTSALNSNA